MSVSLMARVWHTDLEPMRRFVLLCLADAANDEGMCWPSVSAIVGKTGLSERFVRGAIRDLEARGYLKIERRSGRSTVFIVSATPAPGAPLHEVHPCTTCTPPLHPVHPTPAPGAPRTIKNHKEPSNAREDLTFDVPEWIPSEPWRGYLEMRRRKRAPPTRRAVELLFAKLARLRDAGDDPGAVLDQSTSNNWTDVYPLRRSRADAVPTGAVVARVGF